MVCDVRFLFFFSSRRRHTRCALVTGVRTCALPICTVRGATMVERNKEYVQAARLIGWALTGRVAARPTPLSVSGERWRSEERRVGKSVSVRVDLGGRRILKKKKR